MKALNTYLTAFAGCFNRLSVAQRIFANDLVYRFRLPLFQTRQIRNRR